MRKFIPALALVALFGSSAIADDLVQFPEVDRYFEQRAERQQRSLERSMRPAEPCCDFGLYTPQENIYQGPTDHYAERNRYKRPGEAVR